MNKNVFSLFLLIFSCLSAKAVTITTTYTNNNGFAAITFNFANNNTYPVIISEIGSVCGTSATTTAELWTNTTPVNVTTQPTINAANGWVLAATGTTTGITNTTTTTAQMLITGMTLSIPANTTVGMCLNISNYSTGSLRYSSLTAGGPYLNSAGGCDIITGTNIGWAGAAVPGPLANNNRGFIGYITFAPGIVTAPGCVSAPITPANNATTVCSGTTLLKWNKIAAATSYDVYLNTGTGTPTTIVSANQVDTFYNATTTVSPYVWKIIPKNSIGPATGCATFNFSTLLGVTPSVDITISPNDTVCVNVPVTLTATITNGGSAPVYQWKRNNVNVGTNSATYTDNAVLNNNNYKVVLTSNSTGCLTTNTATSNQINVVILPTPVSTITPGGPTAFCAGGSVLLSAQPGAASYQWLSNSTPIANATSSSYVAMYNGYYKVLVTSSTSGCPSISDSVRVTVYQTPVPHINRTGNVLSTASYYANYQWYRDGRVISGATANTYTFANDGMFQVKVTDTAGCSGFSAYAPVNNLAVNGISANDIKMYPNPASNIVYIEAPVPVNAAVRSMDGKLVLYQENVTKLDVSSFSDGVYSVSISDKDHQVIRTEKLTKTAP